jgi:Flp pilus assembly protein TadD
LLLLAQAAIAASMDLAYEPGFESWFEPARAVAAVAVLAASIAVALGAAPAERPAPTRAASLFWIGWMPVAMALHLNLLPLEVPFAERFVFLASLGAIALVATAARRVAARAGMPRAAVVAGVAALALVAATTLHRGHFYRDELAFTVQWAATSPATGNARASHGAALARAGRIDEAVAELREAVRLEPRQASAHYNLGVMLARVGRRDAAIDAFREALRWWSADPDAHYALGVLLAQRGERDAGATHLREALRLRPDFPEASAALRSLASE